ncbi:exodeoxyribonuclease V subunit beta [Pseudidiomarina marina]|uniref:exodeoxyribonuclease V subunit beta n=1 Tax=Pseudidiomarina marina TaxID=502366 RepID=UPI001F53FC11|nr:exodeoxyribonuclease V subunit beta [Pseudidiomarina marina]
MSAINKLQPLTFPLEGSRLIEASAGTGKTYTIAALYLRLVLGHECQRCYTPDEILVVTFTDAATEELRNRIRANLSEAAAYFRGDIDVRDGFLQALKAAYAVDELAGYARLLDLAAQAMDEAAVHTIHGWCNRMLREHAFASGSLFTQQLNTDTQALWQQVSEDYWRTFISVYTEAELQQYQLVINEFADPEALLNAVRPILNHGQPSSLSAPSAVLQKTMQAQQAIRDNFHHASWPQWIEEGEAILAKLRDEKRLNGNKMRVDSVAKWLAQLREWATSLHQANAPLVPSFEPKTGWDRFTMGGFQDALKGDVPEHPLWQQLTALREAFENIPTPRSGLLQHAAQWFQKRFATLQQQRAEMGFDDMLTRLRYALYGEFGDALADTIRQQFPISMVDEFQDTDPVQYAIFDKVYQLETPQAGTGIFLIGDPKQAIYSFRNADIHTYLKARTATSGRHYTLATNYRSTQAMVDASNALFLEAKETPKGPFHFRDPASGDDPLPFIPVSANGLKQRFEIDGVAPAALQFDCYTAEGKQNNANLNAIMANWHAEHIAQLLNNPQAGFVENGELQRVKPSDVAVLVNSGVEAKIIRQALRERGIQSVYLSDRDSVFSSPLAVELLRVLQACAQPRDPSLLRAALVSRLLDLSLTDIDLTLNDELRWDSFAERFLAYHLRWQYHGVLAMIQRLLHDYDVPARLLREVDGERQLTDLLHITELLQQQAAVSEGMSGILRYLAEHIELAREGSSTDSKEQQVRLESDSQLVQVITIHKSKGLQYPLVYLPFIACTKTKDKRVRFPAVYHDSDGNIQVALAGDDETIAAKLDQERLEEDIRKLYVAVTRAQFATFIGLAPFNTLHDTAINYVLSGGSQLELSQWQPPLHCHRNDVADDIAQTWYQPSQAAQTAINYCRMPASFRFESWWVASYSALKYGDWVAVDDVNSANALEEQHDQQPVQLTAPSLDTIHGFPKGADAGTYLHNLLEDAAEEGFALLHENPAKLQEFVVERSQLEPWAAHQEVLTHWLATMLAKPMHFNGTEMRLADLQKLKAEPEFWFPAPELDAQRIDALVREQVLRGYDRPKVLPMQLNGMLKGFIDLVFEHNGKYYVADYKSNYLGPNEMAYTADAMRDKILSSRYDLQYVIYLVALHKLLGVRLGELYDYDQHVGGAVYLFLRGIEAPSAGVFYDKPPRQLIEQLAELFSVAEVLPC